MNDKLELKLPWVRLRAMEPEDVSLIYDIENDSTLWSVSCTNVPYSRQAIFQFIAQSTGDIFADKQVRLMVDNEKGETVAMVDLTQFDPIHLRAEVGIVVHPQYRKQGYAVSALGQLIRYAKDVLHLHQIYAIIAEDNSTSLRLFSSQQFNNTATLKSWLSDGSTYKDALLMQRVL